MANNQVSNEVTLPLGKVGTLIRGIIAHNVEVAAEQIKRAAVGKRMVYEETIVPDLRGEPGVGKTSIVSQVAEREGFSYSSFIPAQYDPAELAGFLFFDAATGSTKRSTGP